MKSQISNRFDAIKIREYFHFNLKLITLLAQDRVNLGDLDNAIFAENFECVDAISIIEMAVEYFRYQFEMNDSKVEIIN